MLSNAVLNGYVLKKISTEYHHSAPLTWTRRENEKRRLNDVKLEYTEYIFKTSEGDKVSFQRETPKDSLNSEVLLDSSEVLYKNRKDL